MHSGNGAEWLTSSYCTGGTCVGALYRDDMVDLVDTKNLDSEGFPQSILRLRSQRFAEFTEALKVSNTVESPDLKALVGENGDYTVVTDSGDALQFSAAEWDAFVAGVRDSEFEIGRLMDRNS